MPSDRAFAIDLSRVTDDRVDVRVSLNGQFLGVLLAPSPEDAAAIAVRLTTAAEVDGEEWT